MSAISTAAGHLQLAVPGYARDHHSALFVLDLAIGVSRVETLYLGYAGAGYANLAALPHGRRMIAYVGPEASEKGDRNSVLLVRSRADGDGWERPSVISRSGAGAAFDLRLFAESGGTVHLVWTQNLSGGLSRDVVRHVLSRDEGGSWSAADDLAAPPNVVGLRAALDSCGALHVILSRLTPRGGRLAYARWAAAGWSSPLPVLFDESASDPEIATGVEGDLLLVWTAVGSRDDAYTAMARSLMRTEARSSAPTPLH